MQTLEHLKHVKLVNFDESKFMEIVVATNDHKLVRKAQNSLQMIMLCSLTTLRYFKAVANLFG